MWEEYKENSGNKGIGLKLQYKQLQKVHYIFPSKTFIFCYDYKIKLSFFHTKQMPDFLQGIKTKSFF